jgi:hypothetical protein
MRTYRIKIIVVLLIFIQLAWSKLSKSKKEKRLFNGEKKLNEECQWFIVGSQCATGLTCDKKVKPLKCKIDLKRQCTNSEDCLTPYYCNKAVTPNICALKDV